MLLKFSAAVLKKTLRKDFLIRGYVIRLTFKSVKAKQMLSGSMFFSELLRWYFVIENPLS